MAPISCAQWSAAVKIGRRVGVCFALQSVGLLSAALGEFEEELLNLFAACIGETPVLADNLEPAFFQNP